MQRSKHIFVVNTEEGEQLANSYNLDLFEASAKDNINVSEAFQDITEKIGYFGMIAGAVTLVALMIRFGVNYSNDRKSL